MSYRLFPNMKAKRDLDASLKKTDYRLISAYGYTIPRAWAVGRLTKRYCHRPKIKSEKMIAQ